ncbi:MAG: archaellin/type IV pilin N-terminal domain-containing protein [Candidatus Baldrarchaeia archaeon]
MLTRRKAISNAVATILLILLAVVSVALIWSVYSHFFVPKADVKLLSAVEKDLDEDGFIDHIEITIKNTGNVPLKFDTSTGIEYSGVKIYNLDDSRWCGGSVDAPLYISSNEKATITVEISNDDHFNLEFGEWYEVYLYFIVQDKQITKVFKIHA